MKSIGLLCLGLLASLLAHAQITFPASPGTSTNGNVGVGAGTPLNPYKLHVDADKGTTAALTHGILSEVHTNTAFGGTLTGLWARTYTSGGTLNTGVAGFFDIHKTGTSAVTTGIAVQASILAGVGVANSTGVLSNVNGTNWVRAFSGTAVGNTPNVPGGEKSGLLVTVSGTGYGNYGADCSASGATSNFGLYGVASGSVGTGYGVYGLGTGAAASRTGVYGKADDGTNRYGVYCWGSGVTTETNKVWYGVYGITSDPGNPAGNPPSTNKAYAVYGTATTYAIPGLPGTNVNANNTNSYAGWFNGHVWVNNLFGTSDARLKRDVKPLTGSLAKINQLTGVSYVFDHALHPTMNLPYGRQLGVLAQELEKVFPELVTNTTTADQYDTDGKLIESGFELKGVNYFGLIPVLLSGIQEQNTIIGENQTQLNDKQAQIDALTARLEKLEAILKSPGKQDGMSQSKGTAQLFQNEPNPFGESTVIRYSLPEGAVMASIVVRSQNGQSVKTFTGLGTGNGQVMIGAGSLAAGSYSYSLIVNGENLDTKTMIVTR